VIHSDRGTAMASKGPAWINQPEQEVMTTS